MHQSLDCSFLSRDYTKCLKGLFSVFVLWHHISQKSGVFYATKAGTLFQMMGYLSVAVFFFISGYGLIKSVNTDYIDRFPKRRILTFYIDILLIMTIYVIASVIMYRTLDRGLIIKTMTWGGTIISNGWYFQVALLLYFLFYFTFKSIKKEKLAVITCSCLVFLFCTVCIICNQSQTLYESVLAFPLGMITGFDSRLKIYRKKSFLFVSVCIFVVMVFCEYIFRGSLLGIVCKMISSIAFCISMICILWLIRSAKVNKIIVNHCFSWIGQRSLEVYALQGLFLNIMKRVESVYYNLPLYAISVTVLTFLFAWLLHIIIIRINSLIINCKTEIRLSK